VRGPGSERLVDDATHHDLLDRPVAFEDLDPGDVPIRSWRISAS